MSNRFKSIDFAEPYVTKVANPAVPIAEGDLQITYVEGVYEGDAATR